MSERDEIAPMKSQKEGMRKAKADSYLIPMAVVQNRHWNKMNQEGMALRIPSFYDFIGAISSPSDTDRRY